MYYIGLYNCAFDAQISELYNKLNISTKRRFYAAKICNLCIYTYVIHWAPQNFYR